MEKWPLKEGSTLFPSHDTSFTGSIMSLEAVAMTVDKFPLSHGYHASLTATFQKLLQP